MQDIHKIGEALFGQQWQRPLARELGLHERTIRHWAAGSNVPTERWEEIANLCRKRGERLVKMAGRIDGETT